MALFEYRESCRAGHTLARTFGSDCALSELQRIRKGASPCLECDRPTRSEVVAVVELAPVAPEVAQDEPANVVPDELPTEPAKPSKKAKGKKKTEDATGEPFPAAETPKCEALVANFLDAISEPIKAEDPAPITEQSPSAIEHQGGVVD